MFSKNQSQFFFVLMPMLEPRLPNYSSVLKPHFSHPVTFQGTSLYSCPYKPIYKMGSYLVQQCTKKLIQFLSNMVGYECMKQVGVT